MLYTIVKKCAAVDDNDDEVDVAEKVGADAKKNAKNVIKGKIKSVAAMSRMFCTLREEQELLLKIKNISPDGKLPRGILLEGKPAIKHAAKQFNIACELDRENEKRPKKKEH